MVRIHEDLDALSGAAAEEIVAAAERAVRERGRFTMSLAGGSTPRRLYEMLATAYRDRIPWNATHIFFGDERCVPPTDRASNYHMANEALLSRVPIPDAQVHRIRGELAPLEAAREYGRLLRREFDALHATEQARSGSASASLAQTFDIALLGVGPDGHTASLFPGSPALHERKHWAMEVEAPDYIAPPRERVTLTFPALNASRAVIFLVAGEEKQGVVEEILGADTTLASSYPAAHVHGAQRTVWLLDRAAATAIDRSSGRSRAR